MLKERGKKRQTDKYAHYHSKFALCPEESITRTRERVVYLKPLDDSD